MLVENYKDRIISKLQTDVYGYSEIQARRIYKSIFADCPDELIPNLEEWLEDRSISRIEYNGVSVRDVMYQDYDKNGNMVYDFLDCLRLIVNYIQSNNKSHLLLSYIWNYGVR